MSAGIKAQRTMHNQTGIPDRIHPDFRRVLEVLAFQKRRAIFQLGEVSNPPQDISHLLRGICILEINYGGDDIDNSTLSSALPTRSFKKWRVRK